MSSSIIERYYLEREGKRFYITKEGFIAFLIQNDTCFITDIFVERAYRKKNVATQMADEVTKIAKKIGCKYLMGQVDSFDKKNFERSMLMMFSYGFTEPYFIEHDRVIKFRKEIS